MSDFQPLRFITGNPHKFEIASHVLGLHGITVTQLDLDTPEIQSDDIAEVARTSALHAAQEVGSPLIKTDVGFSIDALRGFPGAYGKYVFAKLGTEGLLALMKGKENRRARAIEVLAYVDAEKNVTTFQTITEMTILKEPRGEGSVMDRLMVFQGDKGNYGSLTQEEKLRWWEVNDNYFQAFGRYFAGTGRMKEMAVVDGTKIEARAMAEADLPFLRRLGEETMKSYVDEIGLGFEPLIYDKNLRDNVACAQLLFVDGQAAGFLKLDQNQSPWFLDLMQLAPAFQRKGLGAAILERVLDDAKKEGARVTLNVLKPNPAKRLYQRMGFRKIDETPFVFKMEYKA